MTREEAAAEIKAMSENAVSYWRAIARAEAAEAEVKRLREALRLANMTLTRIASSLPAREYAYVHKARSIIDAALNAEPAP